MLGIQVLAWSFTIFTVLGRVADSNSNKSGHELSKLVDNATIILMLMLLTCLHFV